MKRAGSLGMVEHDGEVTLVGSYINKGGTTAAFEVNKFPQSEGNKNQVLPGRKLVAGFSAVNASINKVETPFDKLEQIRAVLPQEAAEKSIHPAKSPLFALQPIIDKGQGEVLYVTADEESLKDKLQQYSDAGMEPASIVVEESAAWFMLTGQQMLQKEREYLILDATTYPWTLLRADSMKVLDIHLLSAAAHHQDPEHLCGELLWLLRYYSRIADPQELIFLGDQRYLEAVTEGVDELMSLVSPRLGELAPGLENWQDLRPAGLSMVISNSSHYRERPFDFRWGGMAYKGGWRRWLEPWGPTLGFTAIMAAIVISALGVQQWKLQQTKQILNGESQAIFHNLLPGIPLVDPLLQIHNAIEQLSVKEVDTGHEYSQWVGIIQKHVPKEAKVQWMATRYNEDGMELVGLVPSYDHLEKLQEPLKKLVEVKEVVMKDATILSKTRDVRFRLLLR